MLTSEIRTENGLSTIYVDGDVISPMTFCSRHNDDPVYTRNLQASGIKVFWPLGGATADPEEITARLRLTLGPPHTP